MPPDDSIRFSASQQSFQRVSGESHVFVCQRGEYAVFYAPCFVCVVPRRHAAGTVRRIDEFVVCGQSDDGGSLSPDAISAAAARRIRRAADGAAEKAAGSAQEPFCPECLTLFLNNACNLECRYCHATPGIVPDPSIRDEAIRTACSLVAASCAQRQCLFTLAFHGGGEPSLDRHRVDRIIEIAREEAGKHAVGLRTYIATNGVMSEDRAHWLAGRFDLVGLSCDGPPDVQNRQRPMRAGGPSSDQVRQTAEILGRRGTPFHVRATVTRETIGRQAEITAHLIDMCAPLEIRLEPVYMNPFGGRELHRCDAVGFVAGFLAARQVGAARRIPVTTSLARPATLYGRHCNVLRHVLNLVPGDLASGCFLESREADIIRRGVRVGAVNAESSAFELDQRHIHGLIRQCSEIPSCCGDCLCCFQCTHGCPDVCVLQVPNDAQREEVASGFRCLANRLLTVALIQETAERAWEETAWGECRDVTFPDTGILAAVYKAESGMIEH
jgi:uncharacterized protein